MSRRTVAVDFDGVLHQYVSRWTSREEIHDPPVDGAIPFLRSLLDADLDVVVFSVRCQSAAACEAIERWLLEHGLEPSYAARIRFEHGKPQAIVYLDDRGLRFEGVFPSVEQLLALKPWNR